MRLSQRIERIVQNLGPINLGIGAIVGGFVLCFLSTLVGMGQFNAVEVAPSVVKDLRFWSALNWSVTFLILFPMFVVFFALQIDQCNSIRTNFAEHLVITGPNGVPVTAEKLHDEWQTALTRVGFTFWLLLIIVVIWTFSDWWTSCGRALANFAFTQDSSSEVRDWSTAAIILQSANPAWLGRKWELFAFSFSAYLYMGMALITYLSALVYSLIFAVFLLKISTKSGPYRLVFKKPMLCDELAGFFTNIYAATVMGLCAAFFMGVEVEYLRTNYPQVTGLLFRNLAVDDIFSLKVLDLSIPEEASLTAVSNNSRFSSLALTCFSLLCLGGVSYGLFMIFGNARTYFLGKVTEEEWRKTVKLSGSADVLAKEAAESNFVKSVVPNAVTLGLLVLLIVLSTAFIAAGLIFVAAILFGIVQLLLRWIKRLTGKPPAGAAAA